jgi:hypothetical protein
MTHLKKSEQTGAGATTGVSHPGGKQDDNDRGAEFGTAERATRGTDRDADETGTSKNQGHGHPREQRGDS